MRGRTARCGWVERCPWLPAAGGGASPPPLALPPLAAVAFREQGKCGEALWHALLCLQQRRSGERGQGGERERRRVDPVVKEVRCADQLAVPGRFGFAFPPALLFLCTWLVCPSPSTAAVPLPLAPRLPRGMQAHKRGLDVEKLHGSKTPAWRNLRGRTGGPKKQSYFDGPEDEEDELEDKPSDGEVDEEEAEEEEAEDSSEARGISAQTGQHRAPSSCCISCPYLGCALLAFARADGASAAAAGAAEQRGRGGGWHGRGHGAPAPVRAPRAPDGAALQPRKG